MYNEGTRAFDASADILARRLLVMAADGTVAHYDGTATKDPVGVSEYGVNVGNVAGCKMINSQGTFEITAAGAITRGAAVYAAAAGKVYELPVTAGDYRRIGQAIEAATADGDIIEILPDDHITVTTV